MLNLLHLIKEKHISSTQCDFIQSFFGENKLKIASNKKIIVFGAGSAGKELEECLSLHGIKIDFFCDNSQEKIGTFLNGIEVISFQDLITNFKNSLILIGNQNNKNEIFDQLIQNEFRNVSFIADSSQFYYYINFPRWKINLSDLEANIEKIELAYDLLSDDLSKEIFINRLTVLSSYADWKSYKKYCELASYPHGLPTSMMQFAANFENQMYFKNDLIYLNEGTVVVDCGAFDGDSYFELRKALCDEGIKNHFCFCLEPDERNFRNLSHNLSSYTKNVSLFKLGAWSKKDTLSFASSNVMYITESCVVQSDMDSKVQKSNNIDTKINVESIDNLIYPQKVNIIKMDVEGSEIEALLGASKTIRKYSPQLIISAYHKCDDLYQIPLIIKQINSNYRFYLRNFSFNFSEMVLIAIPNTV